MGLPQGSDVVKNPCPQCKYNERGHRSHGALGHTGTFQVLSVDLRNRSVDLRSLEKRNVPAEVLEGVPWTTLVYLPPGKSSS